MWARVADTWYGGIAPFFFFVYWGAVCLLSLSVWQVSPSRSGVKFTLSVEKASKWLYTIDEALRWSTMDAGVAQKLSGRLMWATQLLFHKVGRAMVKPIYVQKISKDGSIGPRLRLSLMWWKAVIEEGVCEVRPWSEAARPPCHLYVDAASTPARCAAVLLRDGEIWYSDGAPSSGVTKQLTARQDKQITSLVGAPLLLLAVCPCWVVAM